MEVVEMTMHCACGLPDRECGYPNCKAGKVSEQEKWILEQSEAIVRMGARISQLENLLIEAAKTEQQLAAAQAKIDELMLEYCPEEITQEQVAEWEKHQVAVGDPLNDAWESDPDQ